MILPVENAGLDRRGNGLAGKQLSSSKLPVRQRGMDLASGPVGYPLASLRRI